MRLTFTHSFSLLIALLFVGLTSKAQTVSGVVKDENGQPMPGITVVVQGTTNGTSTDLNGKYELKDVGTGKITVVYTFIGYKNQTRQLDIKDKSQKVDLSVDMEVDAVLLDDFVVVGYGVQRKREVTGSIATVDAKKIQEVPVPSFDAALQGQAAGVQVVQGSGIAGASSVIRIRGIASISSAGDPLIVVDGIPITQNNFINESGGDRGGFNSNPLSFLNPDEIESIEVLKDASATGIYGSRGANGVILVTTKRGKTKGLQFEFGTRFGIARATAKPNMLNSAEFLQLYQEAWENDGNVGLAPLPGGVSWEDARNTDTDWVDETMGTGFKHRYTFSVTKGTDRYNLFANTTFDDNESFLLGNGYRRVSGRINFDYKLHDKVKLSVGSSLVQGTNTRVDVAWAGGLGAAMSTALPIYPIFDEEGNYFTSGNNPVRSRELKTRRTREYRSLSNVTLVYTPIKNLNLKATGNYEHMDIKDDIFDPAANAPADASNDSIFGTAKRFPTWTNNWNYTVTADYRWQPTPKHKFNFLVGHELQRSVTRTYSKWENNGGITGAFFEEDVIDTGFIDRRRTPLQESIFISYFGRANYVMNERYIFQLTGRVDGSSRFGDNNRYGFFPSVSAGWIVSEEDFLKDSKTISYLKVKSSFGVVGNANIPVNQQFATFERTGNYNGEPILFQTNLGDPDLKWETTTAFDAGVEIGFLADRFTAEFSYYLKKTKDVFLNLTLPPSFGFANQISNVGEIQNYGFELSLKSRNIVGEFEWTTDVNLAINENEITSIGGFSEDAVSGGTNDTRVVVGSPVGTNFLVRFSHVDPETGRPVYLDIDGNETFEWDPADRVPVGNVLPDLTGGVTNTFRYKRWGMSFLVYFSIGGNIYDSSSKRQLGVVTDWNMRTEIFDRWREPGDIATYPRLTLDTRTYGSGTPWINTDLWLHDATYARLRNISISYSFPTFKWGGLNFRDARLTFTATNLLTVSAFDGLDPEIARDFENVTDRNMSSNITFLTPPQERSFNLAFNIKF